MGLQDHQTRFDQGNSILIGAQDRGYHPGRHQHANILDRRSGPGSEQHPM